MFFSRRFVFRCPSLPFAGSASSSTLRPRGLMSAQVLSFFWELAALNLDRRVKAAASLITALRTAQAAYEAGSGGALSPDLVYAVRRLVRGLASPRDGARQGFGAALIEVLGAFDEVTPEEVLEQVTSPQCRNRTHPEHLSWTHRPPTVLVDVQSAICNPSAQCTCLADSLILTSPMLALGRITQMESTLQLSGAIKGSEERDVLFGRLFACGALVRSGRVPRLPPKRRGAVASKLSSQLLSCAGAKAFLQEPAACIACEFLASLPATDVVASVWPKLAPLLKPPMAEWQPHALLLALCLARTLPPETFSELVPHCEVSSRFPLQTAALASLPSPAATASPRRPISARITSYALARRTGTHQPVPCPPSPTRREMGCATCPVLGGSCSLGRTIAPNRAPTERGNAIKSLAPRCVQTSSSNQRRLQLQFRPPKPKATRASAPAVCVLRPLSRSPDAPLTPPTPDSRRLYRALVDSAQAAAVAQSLVHGAPPTSRRLGGAPRHPLPLRPHDQRDREHPSCRHRGARHQWHHRCERRDAHKRQDDVQAAQGQAQGGGRCGGGCRWWRGR